MKKISFLVMGCTFLNFATTNSMDQNKEHFIDTEIENIQKEIKAGHYPELSILKKYRNIVRKKINNVQSEDMPKFLELYQELETIEKILFEEELRIAEQRYQECCLAYEFRNKK